MTKIYRMNKNNINIEDMIELSDIIKNNGTVVFPTETVYGLGANALSIEAVEKIFIAKGRPSDNPLIVHISNIDQLKEIVNEIPERAKLLMDKFWPGPLTLLFEKKEIVPDIITAGLLTVAIRMPNSRIALELIEKAKLPIAGPSANISGKPSPTKAEHVINDLNGKVDAIIDGGDCEIGVESTVIDVFNNPPMILRPGGVTLEEILTVLDSVVYDPALDYYNSIEKPKSPGQKYTHYSPKGEVKLFIGGNDKVVYEIKKEARLLINESKRVMILGTDENVSSYKEGIIFSLGSKKSPKTISSNLFDLLRKSDDLNAEFILVEGIEEKDMGVAVMNRLKKASGGKIFKCGE